MYVDPMLYAAEELANAVIIQAATDYRNAMKDLWLCPRNAKAKYMLEECENDIVENGLTEKFSQGEQEPYDRKRPVADLYSSLNTSYQKIIKQLTDLLPAEEKKETDSLLDYIGGGGG